jgi:uncharacterized RDD family membrane protein YckC
MAPMPTLPLSAPPGAVTDSPLLTAAPLPRRMAAFAYEGVLLFGIVFATGLVYAVSVRQTSGIEHRPGLMAVCFLALGLYFVGLWWRSGQTLALKTWHLRIVAATGAPLTPRQALARYIACWVWVLPPLAVATLLGKHSLALDLGLPVAWIFVYATASLLHPRRQFWHDAACGTAIVNAPPAQPLPR